MQASASNPVLVKLNGKIVGPCPVHQLRKLTGFTLQTPVSVPGTGQWEPAFQAIDLKTYFDTPSKNSFVRAQQAKNLKLLFSPERPRGKSGRRRLWLLAAVSIAAIVAVLAFPKYKEAAGRTFGEIQMKLRENGTAQKLPAMVRQSLEIIPRWLHLPR